MSLGYHAAGGKTDHYDFKPDMPCDDFDKTNVAKLMSRIRPPTVPENFNAFPIHRFKSLQEWRQHFDGLGENGVDLGFAVSNKLDRARTSEFQDLEGGNVDAYMEEDDLDEAIDEGRSQAEHYENDINDMLNAAGIEKAYFHPRDFMLGCEYPPAQLQDPEWNPWLAGMASTNIYGQADIMFRRLCAAQRGAIILSEALTKAAKGLEAQKQGLLKEVVETRRALLALKKKSRKLAETKQEVRLLNQEINETKRIPGVQKFLDLSGDPDKEPVVYMRPISSYLPNLYSTDSPGQRTLINMGSAQRLEWPLSPPPLSILIPLRRYTPRPTMGARPTWGLADNLQKRTMFLLKVH